MTTINETFDMLPPEARKEVVDFIEFIARKYLKKRTKRTTSKERILNFAGVWKDMDEGDYQNFVNEVYQRRERAFMRISK
jgi:hypothetical protein